MPLTEFLSSPVTVFVISLIIAAVVYAIGGVISPHPEKTEGKLAPYACGERFPAEKVPVSIHVFDYAALFLVFDIIAMVLVFSMGVSIFAEPVVMFLSIIYGALVLVALLVLVRRR